MKVVIDGSLIETEMIVSISDVWKNDVAFIGFSGLWYEAGFHIRCIGNSITVTRSVPFESDYCHDKMVQTLVDKIVPEVERMRAELVELWAGKTATYTIHG